MFVLRLATVCVALLLAPSALAQCSDPPLAGEYWTVTYNHLFDGTLPADDFDTDVTLTAPCKVFIDTTFIVTVAAHDNLHLDHPLGRTVGQSWRIWDDPMNASTVTLDAGLVMNTDPFGDWVAPATTTYRGTPVDHVIGFTFTPGWFAHGWPPATILASVTADPYADASRAKGQTCFATAECQADLFCDGGTGRCCEAQCAAAGVCTDDGACTDLPAGASCAEAAQCAAALSCVEGTCCSGASCDAEASVPVSCSSAGGGLGGAALLLAAVALARRRRR